MKEKKKVKDPTRNNNFAAALSILRQLEGQKLDQKDLAKRMGVSSNQISRIMNKQSNLTENIISKFQAASDNVFNIQWLRGESNLIFAADVEKPTDQNQLTKEKDKTLELLKCELADKTARLEEKEARISDMKDTIQDLRQQVADQKLQISDLRIMLNLKGEKMPVQGTARPQ